ncbi:MAG: hypothetical protein DHS20C20_19690 [Ardenticatenaceae bacterium]|nr:MAG: hypothetical protein DHS20C20_19690 [Ardenticatenaceae bacterium]
MLLLLAACTQPTVIEQATAVPAPTSEPAATEPALPTETAEPMPTETVVLPPTATASPTTESTPTPIPVATFSTSVDIQNALTLYSETAVIEREPGNKYLNGGAVIFHDEQFHMFSNFFNSWPGETITYYYTSSDGRSWTRAQEEPLFTVADVPLDGRGALVLSGLVRPDGTWVLYYHTFTSGSAPGEIGVATASDPIGPWTFRRTAVLTPGSSGEWDELQVMRVNVLPFEDGYIMYYAGINRQSESRIGLAFSDDGISWEKYDDPTTSEAPYGESDPVLEPILEWEGKWLGRPEVVQSADGLVMLYEGSGGNQTGLAVSQDGILFERYAANPILTQDNMVEGFTFFQGAFFHENDIYFYLIEAGNGRVGTDIFLYTLEGSLIRE